MTTPCTATVTQEARARPGMSATPAWIRITMHGLDYSFTLDVPAYGTVAGTNAVAAAIVAGVQPASMEIASLRRRALDAESLSRETQEETAQIRERLSEVLTGRTRRLFGRALVVLDADGGCWLQDPTKGDSGWGIYYESLAVLWRDMPSLRPVSWDGGGMIVESYALEDEP